MNETIEPGVNCYCGLCGSVWEWWCSGIWMDFMPFRVSMLDWCPVQSVVLNADRGRSNLDQILTGWPVIHRWWWNLTDMKGHLFLEERKIRSARRIWFLGKVSMEKRELQWKYVTTEFHWHLFLTKHKKIGSNQSRLLGTAQLDSWLFCVQHISRLIGTECLIQDYHFSAQWRP